MQMKQKLVNAIVTAMSRTALHRREQGLFFDPTTWDEKRWKLVLDETIRGTRKGNLNRTEKKELKNLRTPASYVDMRATILAAYKIAETDFDKILKARKLNKEAREKPLWAYILAMKPLHLVIDEDLSVSAKIGEIYLQTPHQASEVEELLDAGLLMKNVSILGEYYTTPFPIELA